MSGSERFGGNYHLTDLNADQREADYPGIPLSFCKGVGSFGSPYEFNWPLKQEMFATPRQVGDLARSLMDAVGASNDFFYLRANGILFSVLLNDAKHTGCIVIGKHPFGTMTEMNVFRQETDAVLQDRVREFQIRLKLPLVHQKPKSSTNG